MLKPKLLDVVWSPHGTWVSLNFRPLCPKFPVSELPMSWSPFFLPCTGIRVPPFPLEGDNLFDHSWERKLRYFIIPNCWWGRDLHRIAERFYPGSWKRFLNLNKQTFVLCGCSQSWLLITSYLFQFQKFKTMDSGIFLISPCMEMVQISRQPATVKPQLQ